MDIVDNVELVGSDLNEDDHNDDALIMHDQIAAEWEMWSLVIGRTALPRLEKLRETLPTMASAQLCTADGLNLCCVGLEKTEDVGRLAALNSSLFAVASAQAEIVSGDAAAPRNTMVHLATGRRSLVVVSLVQEQLGHLLLNVSADDVQMGTMVVAVRQAAQDIHDWLTH